MSINQEIFDRQIEHLISLRRYSESARLLIERASKRHRVSLTELFRGNLKLRKEVETEVGRYIRELHDIGRTHVNDFIGAEVDFQVNSLKRSVREFYKVEAPSKRELTSTILKTPLRLSSDGSLHGSYAKELQNIGRAQLVRINQKIRKGITDGRSENQIIQDIMRTAKLSEHQAKTLVTTNFTAAESMIKSSFVEKNKDLFSGYVYTAILDSRTSTICSTTNGLFQRIDEVKVRPPLHWNCRSTLVPVLKSKIQLLDSRSTRLNKQKLASLAENRMTGDLPLRETFEDWLKRQPFKTQVNYLGSEEKVELLQRGALSYKDFFTKLGRPISISALRLKDNLLTYYSTVRYVDKEQAIAPLRVSRPSELIRSRELQRQLRAFYTTEALNPSSSLSLTDYRGTTIVGKRSVRRRTANEFDERNTSFDPFTGEVRSNLYYDPDYSLYQERLDYMKASKALSLNEKAFIEDFVESFDDSISINQRTAVVENLRILFERFNNNAVPWEDFVKVIRAEMNYSVVNTSRLLDRRSRAANELFLKYSGDAEEPSVYVQGKRITLRELQKEKINYERYVKEWQERNARDIARQYYYTLNAPWRAYFFSTEKPKTSLTEKLVNSFIYRNIRKTFFRNDPIGYFERFGKLPKPIKELITTAIKDAIKKKIPFYKLLEKIKKEGFDNFIRRVVRERYRYIVDLQIIYDNLPAFTRRSVIDTILTDVAQLDDKDAVRTFSKLITTVASGTTTDYDTLAIQLGKTMREQWKPLIPIMGSTLQDYHYEGSKLLEFMREQGIIRVNSRGVNRRAIVDLETNRASGDWKNTVSREVEILDSRMLEYQDYNRRIELANRIGVNLPQNKYYAVPGKKTYIDARGNDTKIPLITRSAFADFPEKQIDKDFANMLNHTMSLEYQVDNEFSSFFDDLVRFKDNRGRAAYYDEINAFREEIIRRGDAGYGLMETLRYYMREKTPFTVHARIDSRGRVYYNGYLTPTGGEVVRPFIDSAKATAMTPEGVHQIKIQLASIVGPGTEALSTAGRLAIFKRNEKNFLRIGELISAKTQRDRRIREFLEDPFVQSIDAAEIAKIARFSLEYYRIYKHMDGKLDFLEKGQTVYRIQNKDGIGPNNPLAEKYFRKAGVTAPLDPSKDWTKRPVPYRTAEELKGFKEYFAKYFPDKKIAFEKMDFDSEDLFAFTNPSDYKKWFTKDQIEAFEKAGFTLKKIDNVVITSRGQKQVTFKFEDSKSLAKLNQYKSHLMGESDASASGLQVIALSTGNRGAALTSNVLPTRSKQRIYDLVAQDTVSDPRFQKLLDELGVDITWEDLSKASKYQVMIAFYGAGKAGQVARVAKELSDVLRKKDVLVTTRSEYLQFSKLIDRKIKDAKDIGADDVAANLQNLKKELNELINTDRAEAAAILAEAEEIHPDLGELVRKYSSTRGNRVGPEAFKKIAAIMSEKLEERAPVTSTYITFWKRIAQDFAISTKKVQIPWVTFDGKKLIQTYKPKVQHEVRFYDPVSKRYIRNIYQDTIPEAALLGKGSIGDVRLGLGVNGNHALDASLVRMFHLTARERGIGTSTIHDAMFLNINELEDGIQIMKEVYARARAYNNVKATLDAIKEAGLPEELYLKYLKEAEELGFFDDGFSVEEMLQKPPPGYDYYGWGP